MSDLAITNGQAVSSVLAWGAVLVIVALLAVVIVRKHVVPTSGEWVVGILGALSIALAGAMTASLPFIPQGAIDLELFRLALALFRGIALALFLALLLDELGWAPPLIRRFL
jgi:hypothetical protein